MSSRRWARLYKRVVLEDGKLVGSVLFGDPRRRLVLHLMRQGADVATSANP